MPGLVLELLQFLEARVDHLPALTLGAAPGLVILLFIMVAVTFNDLNTFVFHHIADLFR